MWHKLEDHQEYVNVSITLSMTLQDRWTAVTVYVIPLIIISNQVQVHRSRKPFGHQPRPNDSEACEIPSRFYMKQSKYLYRVKWKQLRLMEIFLFCFIFMNLGGNFSGSIWSESYIIFKEIVFSLFACFCVFFFFFKYYLWMVFKTFL